jgi:hypothetical protein
LELTAEVAGDGAAGAAVSLSAAVAGAGCPFDFIARIISSDTLASFNSTRRSVERSKSTFEASLIFSMIRSAPSPARTIFITL